MDKSGQKIALAQLLDPGNRVYFRGRMNGYFFGFVGLKLAGAYRTPTQHIQNLPQLDPLHMFAVRNAQIDNSISADPEKTSVALGMDKLLFVSRPPPGQSHHLTTLPARSCIAELQQK